MCTVLLPPGDNPIAINKYIKYSSQYFVLRYSQYTFLCSSMRPLPSITVMRQEHILYTQLTKMILTFKVQKTMENKSINSHAQDTTAIHLNILLTGIHCSPVINRQWSDFPLQNNCQCPSHQDSTMAINYS
jgi:hypothetical protein